MLFAPRPNILRQACEFIHVMLNMPLSTWTPMIRSSHLKYLVVTWKQSTLKETKGLGLMLKETSTVISLIRGLDPLKLASRSSRSSIWRSRMQKQPNNELQECLLAVRRFQRRSRGLYLARLQCLISSGHLQGFMYNHMYCWILRWWCRWPAYSSRGNASSLNCHLFVRFHIFL